MPYQRIGLADWRRQSWAENLDANDHFTRFAIKEIKNTYNVDVSVDFKRKSLFKFGQSDVIGGSSARTVMTLGSGQLHEPFASSNTITTISSSSTADTGLATIEGHTVDANDNLTFLVQTATLNGQTGVSLSTPLHRATRIYNASSADWSGNIYVSQNSTLTGGIPESSAINAIGVKDENQTLKAATSLSSVDYAMVSDVYAGISGKGTGAADIRFQVRERGGVFRTIWKGNLDTEGSGFTFWEPHPYIILPANSDIRITAESSGSNLEVTAGFNAQLAIVV